MPFTGTSITYKPGLLYGGTIEHQCSCQRSIGYYLEGVICLAPFCKKPVILKLTGVTNDDADPSVSVYLFYALIPRNIVMHLIFVNLCLSSCATRALQASPGKNTMRAIKSPCPFGCMGYLALAELLISFYI